MLKASEAKSGSWPIKLDKTQCRNFYVTKASASEECVCTVLSGLWPSSPWTDLPTKQLWKLQTMLSDSSSDTPQSTSHILSVAGNFFLQNLHCSHNITFWPHLPQQMRKHKTKKKRFFNTSEAEILNCVWVAKRVCFSGPCLPYTLKMSVCGEWRELSDGIEIRDRAGEEKEINKQKKGGGDWGGRKHHLKPDAAAGQRTLALLWWAGGREGDNKKKGGKRNRLELGAADGIKEGFFISLKQTEMEQTRQEGT